MKLRHLQIAALSFYVGMSISTFGHAWNRNVYPDLEPRTYSAILCAAAWPLYWSAVLNAPAKTS